MKLYILFNSCSENIYCPLQLDCERLQNFSYVWTRLRLSLKVWGLWLGPTGLDYIAALRNPCEPDTYYNKVVTLLMSTVLSTVDDSDALDTWPASPVTHCMTWWKTLPYQISTDSKHLRLIITFGLRRKIRLTLIQTIWEIRKSLM